jgi:Domain of unknown function (DUF4400)
MMSQKHNKQHTSRGLIASSGWLFIQMVMTLILGCFTAVICVIVIFVIVGKSHGVAWLELLQQHYQQLIIPMQPHCLFVFIRYLNSLIEQVDKIVLIPQGSSLMRFISPVKQATQSINIEFAFTVKILLISLKLSIIRVGLLFHWSLLFLGLCFVGLVDGLTQRSIRRSRVCRESAFIYHYAKKNISFSLFLGVFLVVALPLTSQTLQWILAFFAIGFGFTIFMTSKSFKKYL